MMKFLNHRKNKYLLLLPLVFLILNAFYFMYASKEIQDALLREKYDEIIDSIDMLAAAVEASTERDWQEHELNICKSIEFLDQLYQIYAVVYKPIDGYNVLISERLYENLPFDPFDFFDFSSAISKQDHGTLTIGYTPENQTYREMHLYFRWIPLYSSPDERYLVVAGVSQYSVTVSVNLWVAVGQWISMAITFAINLWLIILITQLGYIYEQRGENKWRRSDKNAQHR